MKKHVAAILSLITIVTCAMIAYIQFRPAPRPRVIRINNTDGIGTLIYDDYYPKRGDFDYNDLVLNLKIEERVNSQGNLESIRFIVFPRVHSGGYDHRLSLSIRGNPKNSKYSSPALFRGAGKVSIKTFASNKQVLDEKTERVSSDSNQDVVIFESTNEAFPNKTNNKPNDCPIKAPSQVAVINVVIDNPELNPAGNRVLVDIRRYRFQLYAKKTDQVLEVSDIIPSFTWGDGSPVGIFVPKKWRYTFEQVKASSVYPKMESLKKYYLELQRPPNYSVSDETASKVENWYDEIAPDKQNLLANCELDESLLNFAD